MSDPKTSLIPAEQALDIVLTGVKPRDIEVVSLPQASGRILARDIASLRTQPPFDASAMDGYAVRQDDLANLPATLQLIGQSRAGEPFDGCVETGQAVRIFTGAVVPAGADSIIIQENTSIHDDIATIYRGVEPGKFIRKAGLDFRVGDTLLRASNPLTPFKLALAASMNHPSLPVFRRPVVALIATGDELVMPGETTADGQIIASNTFGLAASISSAGGELVDLGIAADTKKALGDRLQEAIEKGSDVIITTGGASVGDHDLVLPVAEDLGFRFSITKIAMRPGKPFLYGKLQLGERIIRLVGLAGNPVSSLVGFYVFVKPLIQKLAGQRPEALQMHQAILGRDMPENDERAEYMRATLERGKNGELIATALDKQDSSMLANLVRADCLLYRPVRAPATQAGNPCQIVFIA